MKSAALILVTVVLLCVGCSRPALEREVTKEYYLKILRDIYGDNSDFKLARAIEIRQQKLILERTGND